MTKLHSRPAWQQIQEQFFATGDAAPVLAGLSALIESMTIDAFQASLATAPDPGVAMLYEGNANAAQHPALQVTLINAKNEAVTLDFDIDTHLPVKKSFEWRDPVDRQKNLEEEIYENYRLVQGVMTPYNVTGYFNTDMSRERFIFSAAYNAGLDETMFDPNSGYNPMKQAGKQAKKH